MAKLLNVSIEPGNYIGFQHFINPVVSDLNRAEQASYIKTGKTELSDFIIIDK